MDFLPDVRASFRSCLHPVDFINLTPDPSPARAFIMKLRILLAGEGCKKVREGAKPPLSNSFPHN